MKLPIDRKELRQAHLIDKLVSFTALMGMLSTTYAEEALSEIIAEEEQGRQELEVITFLRAALTLVQHYNSEK